MPRTPTLALLALSALPLFAADSASSSITDLLSDFHNSASSTRRATLAAIDHSYLLDNDALTQLLREALHDADPLVSDYALHALTQHAHEGATKLTLSDVLGFTGETAQLAWVQIALQDKDQPALEEAVHSGLPAVQEAAFSALATIDSDTAVHVLAAVASDPNSLSRLAALKLLASSLYTPEETLRDTLFTARSDSDPLIQKFARLTLEQNQARTAVPASGPNFSR